MPQPAEGDGAALCFVGLLGSASADLRAAAGLLTVGDLLRGCACRRGRGPPARAPGVRMPGHGAGGAGDAQAVAGLPEVRAGLDRGAAAGAGSDRLGVGGGPVQQGSGHCAAPVWQ